MGVLVDWPGEAAEPGVRWRFLASESRPPACVVDTLALEQTARAREELNALYVALTRTQSTLVLSSTGAPPRARGQLRKRSAGVGGRRCAFHGVGLQVDSAETGLKRAMPEPFASWELPTEGLKKKTPSSAHGVCAKQLLKLIALDEPESLESRIGEAMHRLLERPPLREGQVPDADALDAEQRAQAARHFFTHRSADAASPAHGARHTSRGGRVGVAAQRIDVARQ